MIDGCESTDVGTSCFDLDVNEAEAEAEAARREAALLYSEVDDDLKEKRLTEILTNGPKNRRRLHLIVDEYGKLSRGRNRLSGAGTSLEAVVKVVVEMTAKGEPAYFAERLYKAMKVMKESIKKF